MSKAKSTETTYVFYDPASGRIVGEYSEFDAQKGHCVARDLEQVKKAVTGTSAQLAEGTFQALQIEREPGTDLQGLKVKLPTKELVPRRRASSKSGNKRMPQAAKDRG